jgi:hypothetical protein
MEDSPHKTIFPKKNGPLKVNCLRAVRETKENFVIGRLTKMHVISDG